MKGGEGFSSFGAFGGGILGFGVLWFGCVKNGLLSIFLKNFEVEVIY